jgi:hypothetical protein
MFKVSTTSSFWNDSFIKKFQCPRQNPKAFARSRGVIVLTLLSLHYLFHRDRANLEDRASHGPWRLLLLPVMCSPSISSTLRMTIRTQFHHLRDLPFFVTSQQSPDCRNRLQRACRHARPRTKRLAPVWILLLVLHMDIGTIMLMPMRWIPRRSPPLNGPTSGALLLPLGCPRNLRLSILHHHHCHRN